jgi:uncharacterized protein YbcI
VTLLKQRIGKGPVAARAYVHDDAVFVLMKGGHTPAEQTRFDAGQADGVAHDRLDLTALLKPELIACVERHTGRKVIGFMTGSQQEPDFLAHIYVLDAQSGEVE